MTRQTIKTIGWKLAAATTFLLILPAASGATLQVPAEYATIQAAIDATTNGDVVEIADGTYTGSGNKDLDFGGRAITVRSASGNPALCIIDCEHAGRGFYFHNGEQLDAVVEGLTITNGHVDSGSPGYHRGGGVHCVTSSPTLRNCVIAKNSTTGWHGDGGGVYCSNQSSPTLDNCIIRGNSVLSPFSDGGGLFCYGASSPVMNNCTISENLAWQRGGGIYCHQEGSPVLTNCTVNGNAASSGGGLCCYYDASPALIKCRISGNSASSGGGIYFLESTGTFINCSISGNWASAGGGGVWCSANGDPTLMNCKIYGNSASGGGGVGCQQSSPTLTNCVMSMNSGNGGGLYSTSGGAPTLTNCILWGDSLPEIYNNSSSPVISRCCVQGGWPGTGNISVDPLFAFADDFHLVSGSPCIDAGKSNPSGGLPAEDPDGNPRLLDGNGDMVAEADMGVYEFNPASPSIASPPAVLGFLAPEGGDNPAEQTLSLRNCGGGTLDWAITGQPSWLTVAPGVGASSGEVNEVTLRADVDGLSRGLHTAVISITDPQAVNSPRDLTITLSLSSTLHVSSGYSTIQSAIDAAVTGDIVEIANGTYTGEGNKDLDFSGKAITLRSASGDPTLCVIDCEGNGRGFHFHSGEGPDSMIVGLTVTNGYIDDGVDQGGGIFCWWNSSPTISNCRIIANTARLGGGIGCNESSPTLKNCCIVANSAISFSASSGGGGVSCLSGSSPTLSNCTIGENSSDDGGGGVYCSYGGVTLTNCVLWGDNPQEIVVESGSVAVVTYSDIQGNWPGIGNIDTDPRFVDPDGQDDDSDTWEDNNYRLSVESPCVDEGSNDGVISDVDLDGHARIVDGDWDGTPTVDMGAYEYLPADLDGSGSVDRLDYKPWVDCLAGPGAVLPANCGLADLDADGDVDLGDFARFVRLID